MAAFCDTIQNAAFGCGLTMGSCTDGFLGGAVPKVTQYRGFREAGGNSVDKKVLEIYMPGGNIYVVCNHKTVAAFFAALWAAYRRSRNGL